MGIYINCGPCRGQGRVICPTCRGTALVNGNTCTRCSDPGLFWGVIGKKLRGNIPCSVCGGSGQRYITQEQSEAYQRQKENQRNFGGGNNNNNGNRRHKKHKPNRNNNNRGRNRYW